MSVESIEHRFSDGSTVTLTHAGNLPDREISGRRSTYDYVIPDPQGHQVSRNRIEGGVNMDFSPADALAAWATFLMAAADRDGTFIRKDGLTADEPLTPEHEWAYQHDAELRGLDRATSEGE